MQAYDCEINNIHDDSNKWGSEINSMPEFLEEMTTCEEMESRYKELLSYYKPFMRDLSRRDECRIKGHPIVEWEFRYQEDKEWTTITVPEYKREEFWRGYYRQRIEIPSKIKKMKRICLHFEGVDTLCIVKVNGHLVGQHRSSIEAFDIDITPVVQEGENLVELEVVNGWAPMVSADPAANRNRVIPGEGEFFKITGEWGNMYGRNHHKGGIWRNVYLMGMNDPWIEKVHVKAKPEDKTVEITGMVKGTNDGEYDGKLLIAPKNFEDPVEIKRSFKVTIRNGEGVFKEIVKMPQIRLWEPDTPFLYNAEVIIEDYAGGVDLKNTSFGMRTLCYDSEIGRYRLNGKAFVYLGVTTINSLNSAYVNGDIDKVVKIILLAKAANFTFMRNHIMSTIPEVDDYFDMLGMPVQQEMDLWQKITPDIVDEALRELKIMVEQHRSHPSVFFYAICSEPAFFKDHPYNDEYMEYIEKAGRILNEEYPDLEWKVEAGAYVISRLKNDEQEGLDEVKGYSKNIIDTHMYPGWYSSLSSIGEAYDSPVPITVGEFGAEGLSNYSTMLRVWPKDNPDCQIPDDPGQIAGVLPRGQYASRAKRWYVPTPRTLREWILETQEYQRFLSGYVAEHLRRCKNLAGYYYYFLDEPMPNAWRKTLLGYDLSPKPAYFEMAKINKPLYISVYIDQQHVFAGDTIKANLWVCNSTGDRIPEAELVWYVMDPEDRVIYASNQSTDVEAAVPEKKKTLRLQIPKNCGEGQWNLAVFLLDRKGEVLASNKTGFKVYTRDMEKEKPSLNGARILILGNQPCKIEDWLIAQGAKVDKEAQQDGASLIDKYYLIILYGPQELSDGSKSALNRYVSMGGGLLYMNPGNSDLRWLSQGIKSKEEKRNKIGVALGHEIFKDFTAQDFMLWNEVEGDRSPIDCCLSLFGLDISRTCHKRQHEKEEDKWEFYSLAEVDQYHSVLARIDKGKGTILLSCFGIIDRYGYHPIATRLLERQINYLLQEEKQIPYEKFDHMLVHF